MAVALAGCDRSAESRATTQQEDERYPILKPEAL
jgi:hypothetical protein